MHNLFSTLVENTMYTTSVEKDTLSKNRQLVADLFFINCVSVVALAYFGPKGPAFKHNYIGQDSDFTYPVPETQTNASVIINLMVESKYISSGLGDKILKFLKFVHDGSFDNKGTHYADFAKLISEVVQAGNQPSPAIKAIYKNFIDSPDHRYSFILMGTDLILYAKSHKWIGDTYAKEIVDLAKKTGFSTMANWNHDKLIKKFGSQYAGFFTGSQNDSHGAIANVQPVKKANADGGSWHTYDYPLDPAAGNSVDKSDNKPKAAKMAVLDDTHQSPADAGSASQPAVINTSTPDLRMRDLVALANSLNTADGDVHKADKIVSEFFGRFNQPSILPVVKNFVQPASLIALYERTKGGSTTASLFIQSMVTYFGNEILSDLSGIHGVLFAVIGGINSDTHKQSPKAVSPLDTITMINNIASGFAALLNGNTTYDKVISFTKNKQYVFDMVSAFMGHISGRAVVAESMIKHYRKGLPQFPWLNLVYSKELSRDQKLANWEVGPGNSLKVTKEEGGESLVKYAHLTGYSSVVLVQGFTDFVDKIKEFRDANASYDDMLAYVKAVEASNLTTGTQQDYARAVDSFFADSMDKSADDYTSAGASFGTDLLRACATVSFYYNNSEISRVYANHYKRISHAVLNMGHRKIEDRHFSNVVSMNMLYAAYLNLFESTVLSKDVAGINAFFDKSSDITVGMTAMTKINGRPFDTVTALGNGLVVSDSTVGQACYAAASLVKGEVPVKNRNVLRVDDAEKVIRYSRTINVTLLRYVKVVVDATHGVYHSYELKEEDGNSVKGLIDKFRQLYATSGIPYRGDVSDFNGQLDLYVQGTPDKEKEFRAGVSSALFDGFERTKTLAFVSMMLRGMSWAGVRAHYLVQLGFADGIRRLIDEKTIGAWFVLDTLLDFDGITDSMPQRVFSSMFDGVTDASNMFKNMPGDFRVSPSDSISRSRVFGQLAAFAQGPVTKSFFTAMSKMNPRTAYIMTMDDDVYAVLPGKGFRVVKIKNEWSRSHGPIQDIKVSQDDIKKLADNNPSQEVVEYVKWFISYFKNYINKVKPFAVLSFSRFHSIPNLVSAWIQDGNLDDPLDYIIRAAETKDAAAIINVLQDSTSEFTKACIEQAESLEREGKIHGGVSQQQYSNRRFYSSPIFDAYNVATDYKAVRYASLKSIQDKWLLYVAMEFDGLSNPYKLTDSQKIDLFEEVILGKTVFNYPLPNNMCTNTDYANFVVPMFMSQSDQGVYSRIFAGIGAVVDGTATIAGELPQSVDKKEFFRRIFEALYKPVYKEKLLSWAFKTDKFDLGQYPDIEEYVIKKYNARMTTTYRTESTDTRLLSFFKFSRSGLDMIRDELDLFDESAQTGVRTDVYVNYHILAGRGDLTSNAIHSDWLASFIQNGGVDRKTAGDWLRTCTSDFRKIFFANLETRKAYVQPAVDFCAQFIDDDAILKEMPAKIRNRVFADEIGSMVSNSVIDAMMRDPSALIKPYKKLSHDDAKMLAKINGYAPDEDTAANVRSIKKFRQVSDTIAKNVNIPKQIATQVVMTEEELERLNVEYAQFMTKGFRHEGRFPLFINIVDLKVGDQDRKFDEFVAAHPESQVIKAFHGSSASKAAAIARGGFVNNTTMATVGRMFDSVQLWEAKNKTGAGPILQRDFADWKKAEALINPAEYVMKRIITGDVDSNWDRISGSVENDQIGISRYGVYCAPNIDKASIYATDKAYTTVGEKGWIFEMDVALGNEHLNYIDGKSHNSSLVSQEFAIYDWESQYKINRAYEVIGGTKKDFMRLRSKHNIVESDGHFEAFGLKALLESVNKGSGNIHTFVFAYDSIPTPDGQLLTVDEFSRSKWFRKDRMWFENASTSGIALRIKTSDNEGRTFMIYDVVKFRDSDGYKIMINQLRKW